MTKAKFLTIMFPGRVITRGKGRMKKGGQKKGNNYGEWGKMSNEQWKAEKDGGQGLCQRVIRFRWLLWGFSLSKGLCVFAVLIWFWLLRRYWYQWIHGGKSYLDVNTLHMTEQVTCIQKGIEISALIAEGKCPQSFRNAVYVFGRGEPLHGLDFTDEGGRTAYFFG